MKNNILRVLKDKFEAFKHWMENINISGYFRYRDFFNTDKIKGEVFFELTDLDGNLIEKKHIQNIPTKDVRILIARLLRDPSEPANGINMLAVGTGAPGNLLNPDAPDNRQRKLFAEIARKTFSSVTFRDSGGVAVAYYTNIIDFTTTFGNGEAVGPWNEMGLVSTKSNNPSTINNNPDVFPNYTSTIDVSNYDTLCNIINFSVMTKPSASIMSVTWRITI